MRSALEKCDELSSPASTYSNETQLFTWNEKNQTNKQGKEKEPCDFYRSPDVVENNLWTPYSKSIKKN